MREETGTQNMIINLIRQILQWNCLPSKAAHLPNWKKITSKIQATKVSFLFSSYNSPNSSLLCKTGHKTLKFFIKLNFETLKAQRQIPEPTLGSTL